MRCEALSGLREFGMRNSECGITHPLPSDETEDRVFMRYVFNIMSGFTLVEVSENTGINKTKCHALIQKSLENGAIVQVGSGNKPKYYRYVGVKQINGAITKSATRFKESMRAFVYMALKEDML